MTSYRKYLPSGLTILVLFRPVSKIVFFDSGAVINIFGLANNVGSDSIPGSIGQQLDRLQDRCGPLAVTMVESPTEFSLVGPRMHVECNFFYRPYSRRSIQRLECISRVICGEGSSVYAFLSMWIHCRAGILCAVCTPRLYITSERVYYSHMCSYNTCRYKCTQECGTRSSALYRVRRRKRAERR